MLHTYQADPFADPIRQHQFDAVAAALAVDSSASDTLLLGNFPLSPGTTADAVVVRLRSITLLLFVPHGGLLHIPDLRYGSWQLDDVPLAGNAEADNPFQQFREQREAVAAWLAPRLPADAANLQFISGLVLFAEPVRFGPEVEERMSSVPTASLFHLLPNPARFTRRLAQLASPEIDLTAADVRHLAAEVGLPVDDQPLAPAVAPATVYAPSATDLLRSKAGRLWRWLGAEDVDELDRADSGYEVDVVARSQEKARLEELRATLQVDLSQQLRAMEAREEEREQRISQLQHQLAAAPISPNTSSTLQEQLAQEKQEKAALESSIQAYRAELENRNQELGTKIQQLENLLQRFAAAPLIGPAPSPAPVHGTPPAQPPTSLGSPAPAPAGPSPSATTSYPSSAGWSQEARKQVLAGVSKGRTVLQRFAAWATPHVTQLRHQPRNVAYAAAGAALLLAVAVVRCSDTPAPVPFRQGGLQGLLTASGDTLVPARYASIGEFQGGRAVVEQNKVFGFIDDEGQEVVAPAYDALFPYSDGYARARIGKFYTFLNMDGEEFGAYFYSARDFANKHAAVLDYRGWFYITGPDAPTTPPPTFQEAYSFDKGLARVKTKGAFTFVSEEYLADTTAGTAPFGRYSQATDFDPQERAWVRQNGRGFYINREGEELKN
ncbi:WG repeat-containing protein [Hymenobacter sp. AT01-02]|uniref:WG repeat-containing protein n=1 Tax=Hymenobacter sp. AT01-02 TaxID=1571877 RepID=UPI0005F25645|nr:WG repeat-containing protein [Hymenobacter sp. AT01-02]